MGKKSVFSWNWLGLNRRNQGIITIILFLSTAVFFQNCTQSPTSFIKLNNFDEKNSNSDSSGGGIGGNGGGVEGKPINTYLRLTPNKYCEHTDPVFAKLNVFEKHAELIRNDVIDCKPSVTQINIKELHQSELQNEVISYKDGVFWSKEYFENMSKLTNNNSSYNISDITNITFVEEWCQATNLQGNNQSDFIIYNTGDSYAIKVWQSKANSLPNVSQFLNVNRQLKSNFIKYFNSEIEIEIAASQLVPGMLGSFKAKLKSLKLINTNQNLICQTAGQLDSIAWPTPLKLVNRIKQMQFLKNFPGIVAIGDTKLESNIDFNTDPASTNIDELFYFDWKTNKRISMFQANKKNAYQQTISNFQVSPAEDQIVFRSNVNSESTFELFSIAFPGIANLRHLGNSLVNNLGLKLNTYVDFMFSLDGNKLLFKDDSQRLTEASEIRLQRQQLEENFNFANNLSFLQSYDLKTNQLLALHGDLLDPSKGTAVKDYYELDSSTTLARIGSANFSLNANGSNKFYLLNNLNQQIHELPIDLSSYKTSNLKSSGAVWIPDFNVTYSIDPVINSKVLVNFDKSGFLFLAGSWDLMIHWFYYNFIDNSLHPAPLNFIPLKYITDTKVIGLCNQNKDQWIRREMKNIANCYWDFISGKTYYFDQTIHLTQLDSQVKDRLEYLVTSNEKNLTQICTHFFDNLSNICHTSISAGFYHIEKIHYIHIPNIVLILADANNDQLDELYLYEIDNHQLRLLSDQFDEFGSVLDFFVPTNLIQNTPTPILSNDKQSHIFFYSKNPYTNQYYFFEYLYQSQ